MDGLFGSGIWGLLVILGPIVLGLAIWWAMKHNRGTRGDVRRTERATHDLYDGDPVDRREG